MKKNLLSLIALITLTFILSGFSLAQNGFPDVTLYKDANYSGDFLFVKSGSVRFTGQHDFNDLASSIEVPKGFVAIIYEHADDKGGYGRSVDLMESCDNLAKFDLDNKISYITVFSANRAGFVWVRGRYNGKGRTAEYMPGHWERSRADGVMPDNSVAVVSPGSPSNTPISTVIQRNNANFDITSLGQQTSQEAQTYSLAEKLMGVIGSDYRGAEEIGSAASERASNNILIPDNINFWYPQKSARDHRGKFYKRTLSGIVKDGKDDEPHSVNIEGTFEDFDVNIDIKPAEDYMYLIRDGHKPELSSLEALKVIGKQIVDNPLKAGSNPCTKPFESMEAEIDLRKPGKELLVSLAKTRINKQIAVYGPWIYDIGHCHKPEIHPAEQIWWSQNSEAGKTYYLNLMVDSSKRFWWRSQMDDGTKLRPWGAPPINGTFAIAFETQIGGKGKKFEVSNISDYNVATYPNLGNAFNLVYQNQVLVSFVPNNNSFKVSFEKVGLKPGTTNIVRGFLVIETSVGTVTQISKRIRVEILGQPPIYINVPDGAKPEDIDEKYEKQVFKKVDGHYLFKITQSDLRSN